LSEEKMKYPSRAADQRQTGRIPHEAHVRYSVGGQDEYRPAKMFNVSNTGMYLELTFPPPKLGANLLIEDEPAATWVRENPPRACYYAKVIWKRNLPDSEARYGVGLRYLSMSAPRG
jgi:hypothetical protein